MQEFCPLCLKNGIKNRIKLLQINLQEAIWACQSENCIWPFGYKDCIYVSRKIGKTWSCYWDDCGSQMLRENSSNNSAQWQLFGSLADASENQTMQNIGNKKTTLKQPTDNSIAVNKQNSSPSKFSYMRENTACVNNQVTKIKDSIKDSNFKPSTESFKFHEHHRIEDTNSDSSTLHTGEQIDKKDETTIQISFDQNLGSQKALPQIRSIAKANIELSDLYKETPSSACKVTGDDSTNEPQNINNVKQRKRLPDNVQVLTNLNFNTTTKDINSISITCASEAPVNASIKSPMRTQTKLNNPTRIKAKPLSFLSMKNMPPEKKCTPLTSKKLSSGKHYEKFNFGCLKSKMEVVEQKKQPDDTAKKESPTTTIANEIVKKSDIIFSNGVQNNSGLNNCVDSSLNETEINTSLSVSNPNDSIDTVLEDLLTKDYSISEDVSDDWLNSLLN